MKITVQDYRRTQTKHRKAKKGHGWTKLERIEMDCIWVSLKNVGPPTGDPSSEYEEFYSFFFLLLCKYSAKRDLWHILLPNNRIGPRETWLSPCSIWGCCVTTVGRFWIYKALYGNATVLPVKSILLIFLNKIYLPCCCVVFFVVCQLLRPIYAISASYRSVGFHCLKKDKAAHWFPECPPLEASKSTENNPADSIPP